MNPTAPPAGPHIVLDAPEQRLGGSIESVTFHDENRGFCVLRVLVRGQRHPVVVCGHTASVSPGEQIECVGGWETHRLHGRQFRASILKVVPPSTVEGIERYLGSGMVRGIGPKLAATLVGAFGQHVFDIIENDPEQLETLHRIGPTRRDNIVRAWREQRRIREIMIFLQSHGVGTGRSVRIYKTYGDRAIATVSEDPYRLALDIDGIGFATSDTIARNLGIPKDAPVRARGGVRHVTQALCDQGDCAVHRKRLIHEAARILEIPGNVVETAVEEQIRDGVLVEQTIDNAAAVFPLSLHRAEVGTAAHVQRLRRGPPPWPLHHDAELVARAQHQAGITLAPSQRHAVHTVLSSKVSIVTGGPGVGKTTILQTVLHVLRELGMRVQLCAPTGRAAKRLSQSTGAQARTIHRLLEVDPATFGFKHDRDNPLELDVLVIDEASMIDVSLMNRLLAAVPDHAAVIVVGDVDQLPSVNPGAVLSDLIASGVVPTVRLTEIFRQAANSRIIVNAHRINAGQMPEPAPRGDPSDFYLLTSPGAEHTRDLVLDLVSRRLPSYRAFDPVRDIQVLAPMNRGDAGTATLNVELQKLLNPHAPARVTRLGTTFAVGDKVLQRVNNYHKDVFNGDVGQVSVIDTTNQTLLADYDGRAVEYEFGELDELCLAYCMSVHKSQGSEYPVVVIPLSKQHYTLLDRCLLYTGVTRGKTLVVIASEPDALRRAVRNRRSRTRLTGLRHRLQGTL